MKPAPGANEHLNAKILFLSDEPATARVWEGSLKMASVDLRIAGVSEEVMEVWAEELPDLIVLESFHDQQAGLDLVRKLRMESIVPLLYLTNRADEAFLLEAYQAGVDECITSPIGPRLLQAKVAAWLRRTLSLPLAALDEVEASGFRLNLEQRRLSKPGCDTLRLTVLEARLLYLLMSHPGQVVPGDQIVEKVWGYYGDGDNRLLKNLIYRLRRKIEPDPSQPRFLLTEGSSGYKFHVDET